MAEKYVYSFGGGKAEGKADMKNLLGGKGANLAEMNLIGVPVPAGFTISAEACIKYYELGKEKMFQMLDGEVKAGIDHIEKMMGAKFGDRENPLLVSVRYDGYCPESGYERRRGRRSGKKIRQ